MYRFLFRPRWLFFHAIVAAGVVSMVAAGFWQLDRLTEREDFNAVVRERSQSEPADLRSVLSGIDDGTLSDDTAEWLPVTVEGTYLPDQVLEFNNSQGGRAGDNVLTALLTVDGDTVIVNRGFIPLGIDVPPAPPAPSPASATCGCPKSANEAASPMPTTAGPWSRSAGSTSRASPSSFRATSRRYTSS